MATSQKVALVTGGNKGIGFAVVRGLCKQFDGDVVLTARNGELGRAAVSDLEKEGLHPKFHQLDITDKDSIDKVKSFLQNSYGGLDVLINNAGISFAIDSTVPFDKQAVETVGVNFTGTVNVSTSLFPLLREHARVVHVSSTVAQWVIHKLSDEIKHQFFSPDLTIDQLVELVDQFVKCSKSGALEEKGWYMSAYGISKIGITVLGFIQQRSCDTSTDIIVNSCCPGFVDTDMTRFISEERGRKRTPDEGADTPLYLALLPAGAPSPKGEFVSNRTIQNISDPKPLPIP